MDEENIEIIRELINRYELSHFSSNHADVPYYKFKELNDYLRVWYPHATTDSDGRRLYPNTESYGGSWVTAVFGSSKSDRNAFYLMKFAEDLGITHAEIREAFNTVSTTPAKPAQS